jgi:hypothetical protein
MEHPVIKLQFDQRLDRDMAWSFYGHKKGGCDFWEERALRYHPVLIDIEKSSDKKAFLDNYVSSYYISHNDEIISFSNKTIEYLNQTQEKYFPLVDKIFNNHPWPQKEMIGDFSIFDFCPRFLEDGEFQVCIYDERNVQLFVIFHECLHFMFYDFALNKFPEIFAGIDTGSGKFWVLAEVFNAVIQSTDDFVGLHGKIDNIGYPDHQELIRKGSLMWKEDASVPNWISKMLGLV